MSNKVFLSLGDVIQITAPDNLEIHNHIYLIHYLDDNIIKLIDATSDDVLKEIELNVADGKLRDESIKEIALLSHPKEKGFARQHQLLPETWIDLFLDGDVPSVLTGKIVQLEEDMIEIETYPDKKRIFIDFAYKGLPRTIPIIKIDIRESPIKVLTPSPEAAEEDEEGAEEVVEIPPPPDLQGPIEEADKIIFGDEEEYMTQMVDVPEEERIYGITQQSEDMLDELLASIPTSARTNKVMNNIHLMIERFQQLRKIYSIFDEYGNPVGPLIKGANYKPLVETLKNLNQKLYWIVPIVKNRKKLYDILNTDFDDIITLTLAEIREAILTIINTYKENSVPGDENKYDFLMEQLRPYLTPFDGTTLMDNILITKEVKADYDVVVNNLEDFESTTFGIEAEKSLSRGDPPMTQNIRFMIGRYIQGLTKLINVGRRSFKTNVKRVGLTPADTMDIQSYMLFPAPLVHYSNINLPNSSILQKAQLHVVSMGYWNLLKTNTRILSEDVENINHFLKNIVAVIHDDDGVPGEDKYNAFLESLVPTTKNIFSSFKKYIQNANSYMNIIAQLQPFMIYSNDISYRQYEEIIGFMEQSQATWRKIYIENQHQVEKYQKIYYSLSIVEDFVFVREFYLFSPGFIPTSEIISTMLQMDGARIYTLLLSQRDIHLHGYMNIENVMEEQLTQIDAKLKEEQTNNTCQEYILAKRYLEEDEIDEDNDKDIFFDKRYDITRYGILEELNAQRASMESAEFQQFIVEHLQKIGLKGEALEREADALLKGKRQVIDGDYAILSLEGQQDFKYYKRENNIWVLDESIGGEEWSEIFCNLQKKCLRVKNKCNDMDINKSRIEQELLKEIVEHFDNDMEITRERLQALLAENLAFYKARLAALIILSRYEDKKYDVQKMKIGFTYEQKATLVSPHAYLRDMILAQSNFPKKQQDIKHFVARFCRIGSEDEESPYMYYDAALGVPLLPTFFKSLADAFEENKYAEVLQKIVRERGTLSDSGDTIVDKHSGYEIKKIDYVILEEYNEKGFRQISRELLEEDAPHQTAQVSETKDYASEDSQLIANMVNTMGRFLNVPLDSQIEFIIKNVKDVLYKIIPSKELYEKMIQQQKQKKQKKKKKKKDLSYRRIKNTVLAKLTLCYIILSIQTMIPSPRTNKTFHGCKRSFKGYPFDGAGNRDFLTYVACIVYNIKLEGEPWIGLKQKRKKGMRREDFIRKNISELTNNLVSYFETNILPREDTKIRMSDKRTFLAKQQKELHIPEEHQITTWNTFLPPLQLIHIPNIHNVSSSFIESLFQSLKDGSKEQFEKLSIIRGKIILYSLSIQENIQRIINKSGALLKNAVDEPFLENVCCNIGTKNTIEYFSQNNSIDNHNKIVRELSDIIEGTRFLSMAPYLYDPRDTRLVNSPTIGRFTEKTIYKTFIRYCRFNSGLPLSEHLQGICVDNNSEFLFTDTFEEKMRILKDEGKHYTIEQFYKLLMVVERENIVDIDLNVHMISARNRLESLLDNLDAQDVNHPLLAMYRETLDYVDIQEDEPQIVTQQMKTYLEDAIHELREVIFEFIRDNSTIAGVQLTNIKHILETLGYWIERGEGISMSSEDETNLFSAQFIKNNIITISDIYPSIILDKVDYEKVKIPQHWNFSANHQHDIRQIISSEGASLKRFYDNPHLSDTLRRIRDDTRNILRLIEFLPFFAKTRKSHILFGGNMNNHLMEFYYLSILHIYISHGDETIVIKEKDGGGDGGPIYASGEKQSTHTKMFAMKELEIVGSTLQLSNDAIASLISQYLLNFEELKKKLNVNNDIIKERALKSREKEKNKMTRELGAMAPAAREVEDLMKTHRLGKWSIGMTRALFEYDEGQYDRERKEMERDAVIEKQLQEMKGVNPMNKNIYKMDVVAEHAAETDAMKEAYTISDLPEDDDYGERDGDEGY